MSQEGKKKSPLKEVFIGSNTDKIIRYSEIPVFIPKYPAEFGIVSKEICDKICQDVFKKILYPTDWSECAKLILQYIKGLKDAGIEQIVVAHGMNEKAMRLQTPEKFKEFERQNLGRLEEVKKRA